LSHTEFEFAADLNSLETHANLQTSGGVVNDKILDITSSGRLGCRRRNRAIEFPRRAIEFTMVASVHNAIDVMIVFKSKFK